MLKIIRRIVLILLAAGIICGGLYLYANNSGATLGNFRGGGFRGELQDRPQFDSESTAAGTASSLGTLPARPQGGFRGEDRDMDRDGGSLFAFTGILFNLGKVAGITLVVILIQWIVGKLRRRWPSTAAKAA